MARTGLFLRTVVTLACLLCASVGSAQPVQQAGSGAEPPFPRWDVAGGVGTGFVTHYEGADHNPTVPGFEWAAEVGRYWTAHLKTSVTASNAGTSNSTPFYTETQARYPIVVAAALVYQFRGRELLRPYFSAGIRLAWLAEIGGLYSRTPPFRPLTDSQREAETSVTRLDARPAFGAGLKAYFANGRVFMRPELLLAFDPHNDLRPIARIMVGGDF